MATGAYMPAKLATCLRFHISDFYAESGKMFVTRRNIWHRHSQIE
jgi:hypothetical protein